MIAVDFQNIYYKAMSSKKIIRLKTPSRGKDLLKSHQEYYQVSGNLEQETIMKGAQQQSPTSGYGTLIEELNKSYKQIENLKNLLVESQQIKEALLDQNELLKGRLDMLERQCLLQKEKYHLQRENHQRLRGFYENREKQWMGILTEQRRLLEYYDIKSEREADKKGNNMAETTAQTNNNSESQNFPFFKSREGFTKRFSSKGLHPVKKAYSASKHRLSQGHTFFHHIFQEAETHRVPQSQRRSPQKSSLKQIREREQPKMSYHNQQSDQLFEAILRKTLYRLRDEGQKLQDLFRSEDMLKLKKAKTSTRQRLQKTLKKLRFEIENQKELKMFVHHIEKQIMEKKQEFRGDLVYCFLEEKLKECESLAVGSNSEINRFCSHPPSEVSQTIYESKHLEKDSKQGKKQSQRGNDSHTLIQQLKSSNFELLLASNVKGGDIGQKKVISVMRDAEVSDVLRHSQQSSFRTLSDLINGSRDYLQELTRV